MLWIYNRIDTKRFSSRTFEKDMKQVVNDTAQARRFLDENRRSQSEIGSWEIDLLFCDRMLDIYGLKVDAEGMRKTMLILKERIQDLLSIRLENLKTQLKENEVLLKRLVDDELLLKDRQMPFRDADDKSDMDNTRIAAHALQNQLYGFIEELKSI